MNYKFQFTYAHAYTFVVEKKNQNLYFNTDQKCTILFRRMFVRGEK